MEIDNRGREYRFQMDWSFGDQMFHIRCDEWSDFVLAKEFMESVLPKRNAFPDDIGQHTATPQSAVTPQTNPTCPVHHTAMKYRSGVSKAGKNYAFWSCTQKNPDGSWCNQKG